MADDTPLTIDEIYGILHVYVYEGSKFSLVVIHYEQADFVRICNTHGGYIAYYGGFTVSAPI